MGGRYTRRNKRLHSSTAARHGGDASLDPGSSRGRARTSSVGGDVAPTRLIDPEVGSSQDLGAGSRKRRVHRRDEAARRRSCIGRGLHLRRPRGGFAARGAGRRRRRGDGPAARRGEARGDGTEASGHPASRKPVRSRAAATEAELEPTARPSSAVTDSRWVDGRCNGCDGGHVAPASRHEEPCGCPSMRVTGLSHAAPSRTVTSRRMWEAWWESRRDRVGTN